MVSPARSHTRTFGLILCLAAPLVVPLGAQAADPDAPETLVPIGGGYQHRVAGGLRRAGGRAGHR